MKFYKYLTESFNNWVFPNNETMKSDFSEYKKNGKIMKFRSYLIEAQDQLQRWNSYLAKNRMLKGAVDILNKIESKQYQAYIVGGCVRDLILGNNPHDIDIATNMPIDEIAKIWKIHDIGKSKDFGIVVVNYGGNSYEVAQFRQDSYIRPKTVRKILEKNI